MLNTGNLNGMLRTEWLSFFHIYSKHYDQLSIDNIWFLFHNCIEILTFILGVYFTKTKVGNRSRETGEEG